MVGFGIIAVIVASGGDSDSAGGGYDEVAWCQAAGAVSARSGVLDPGFGGDPNSELINLNRSMEDALLVAPEDLRPELARVLDWAINIDTGLASGSDLAVAIADALGVTDSVRLDAAVDAINESVVACGHSPIPAAG